MPNIRPMELLDISAIVDSFSKANLAKPVSTFEAYYQEQIHKERLIWILLSDNQIAGYVTLKWNSHYKSFRDNNIPEIMDLNVLPQFRGNRFGSMLLDIAEEEAKKTSSIVGLGVGLYAGYDGGYGMAQRLYVNRGYIPDGKGITYNYECVIPGNSYPVDDDLLLWLTKKLK